MTHTITTGSFYPPFVSGDSHHVVGGISLYWAHTLLSWWLCCGVCRSSHRGFAFVCYWIASISDFKQGHISHISKV
jgi:hypothetical protein